MEASKCPKCGEEPSYLEHMEKWYCFECNSYMDEDLEEHDAHEEMDEEHSGEPSGTEEEVRTCKNCGAEMDAESDGEDCCSVCEGGTEEEENKAQALLDEKAVESESFISEALAEEAVPTEEHKPTAPAVAKVEPTVRMCPTCGRALKWIDKYQRHYCYGCKKYAPRVQPDKTAKSSTSSAAKTCPECGKELKLIEKYKEYYCYGCKKYPFVKKRAAPAKTVPKKQEPNMCTKCGKTLSWIQKYERHYCYTCKAYASKGTAAKKAPEKKTCPLCKGSMKFVPEYNEWYCYTCKKYSLRPNKPVLLF